MVEKWQKKGYNSGIKGDNMKKILILLLVIFFLSSLFVAFSGNSLMAAEQQKKPCQHHVVKCPVSNKVIAKDAMNIKTEYKGKTYYFCCEGCKAKFEKNPEKYAKSCSHKPVYVCPMEKCKYKSDKPGKCPKCGMDLKKTECTCKDHNDKCDHKKKEKEEDK
jgi:YHS domain-containing protein